MSAAQIAETNRQFTQDLTSQHTLHNTVTEELKKQTLLAVPSHYLSILEDTDFGYADVNSRAKKWQELLSFFERVFFVGGIY
jgi:hypothetical protein